MNKYIKKPLCYSAISALLLTETSIASVYELVKGDGNVPNALANVIIVEGGTDKDKIKVKGEEAFKNLVRQFTGNALPVQYKAGDRVGVIDNFSATPKSCNVNHSGYTIIKPDKVENQSKLKKNEVSGFYEFDSQMLGAAVFIRSSKEPSQVYVAKKIPYLLKRRKVYEQYGYTERDALTTSYVGAESFKKRTDVDHTERQLVAAILSENGLDKNSDGTMCIYTKGHPCVDDSAASAGGRSCVNYYKKLASLYPRIKFHVYFSKNNDITENDINTIGRKVGGPVGNLYEYEYFKGIAKTGSLPRYFRQRQNTAFNFQFKYDSVYLRYLLNHLNGHKMAGNGCEVKKVGELYNIRITYGSNGSLTFDKIRSAEDITSYNSLQAIVNHIGEIEATGQSCLSPEGGHVSTPIIPINDFNKAYNDDRKISAENNLEFEPLDLT